MHCCPLCGEIPLNFYYEDKRRTYWQCSRCDLVSVDPASWLDATAEKAIYDLHENDPSDEGYCRFLTRLAAPLIERLPPHAQGLDFGCGPGPALSGILEKAGHPMALYDCYYYPAKDVLTATYDFITATEVIEHIYDLNTVWQQWLHLVKPGGWIGVMTKLAIDVEAFSRWHYKNDPTHVAFFSARTFQFLAKRDQLAFELVGKDVILLRKRSNDA